jgi:ElaB/YqjD/DUF883 family membrane-anchored ribosome-binding protein
MAQTAASAAKDRLADMADATGERLKQTAADAQEMAAKAADQAAKLQETAKGFMDALERSARDKPLQTLAGVAAAAFVLGAILKR